MSESIKRGFTRKVVRFTFLSERQRLKDLCVLVETTYVSSLFRFQSLGLSQALAQQSPVISHNAQIRPIIRPTFSVHPLLFWSRLDLLKWCSDQNLCRSRWERDRKTMHTFLIHINRHIHAKFDRYKHVNATA